MKKIIFFLSVLSCNYTSGQKPVKKPVTSPSNNNNQLLWYKGKKVNDSTLIHWKAQSLFMQKKRGEIAVKLSAKEDKMMIRVNKELEMSDIARQGLWGEATFKIKVKVTHAPLPYKTEKKK